MRILYIVNGMGFAEGISIGGADKRVVEVARRFAEYYGAEIEVLTTSTGYEMLKKEGLDARYWTISSPFSWWGKVERVLVGRMFSYIFEIFKSLNMRFPISDHSVVYTSSDLPCDTIFAWNYKRKNPHIFWVAMIHHLISTPWKRKGSLIINFLNYFSQRLSFKLIGRGADFVFAYNTPEGEIVRECFCKMGFPRKRLRAVMNGVDYAHIIKVPAQDKVFDACFVGGIRLSKGIFDLVEIWKRVVEKNEKARLAVIGGGSLSLMNQMKRKISQNGLSDNVIIMGVISGDKLFQTIKSSKVFAFPSYEEGWGIAVCEAMSCGLPVIAYNLPVYEIFGEAITKIPIGDKNSFANEILRVLSDKELGLEMSKKAISIASQFDWKRAADEEWGFLSELQSSGLF